MMELCRHHHATLPIQLLFMLTLPAEASLLYSAIQHNRLRGDLAGRQERQSVLCFSDHSLVSSH